MPQTFVLESPSQSLMPFNHTYCQVLRSASKKLGVRIYLNNFQGASEPGKPCIQLKYAAATRTFDFRISASPPLAEENEDMRKVFDELFGNLLPYSNKQVACQCFSRQKLARSSGDLFSRRTKRLWNQFVTKKLFSKEAP
jgi:hypothetical protein